VLSEYSRSFFFNGETDELSLLSARFFFFWGGQLSEYSESLFFFSGRDGRAL
jgi:hypothetical protein